MKRIFTLVVSLSLISIASISYGQAPVVTPAQSFSINENSAVATVVGTALASNTPTSWAITVNTTNNAFAISAAGQITVNNVIDLDREAGASLSITVTATNISGTSPGVPVTINLNDVNEFTPVVTAAQSRTINENLANASNVGTVLLATDGDATAVLQTWTISTNVNPDADGNQAFAINAATGQLTVNDAGDLDRETSASLNIQVTVSDGTNTSAAQTVTINLNDVNEFTPVVTAAQSRTINENLANASNVGTVLLATDGDATAVLQTWTISTNVNPDADGNQAFAINAATGQLTVNDAGDLDRETSASLNIQVTVSDGTNTSAAQTVTINLNDLNDVLPVVTAAQSRAIDENSANGSTVGAVLSATDGDVTATTFQTWTISTNVNPDADANPAFAINASTGQLTVNDVDDLDRETSASLNIQVTVSDGTNTSAAQTVTINLNDLNDVTPIVTAAQSRAIDENSANGSNVGAVLGATDGDVTATVFQTWTISTNSNPDADANPAFAINAATGQLTVNDVDDFDRETSASLTIQVTVSDGTFTSAAQSVTININDVNEFTPVVTAAQSRTINENLANASNVGAVLVATDGDATAVLQTWTISANVNPDADGNQAFAITAATGQLTVNDAGDLDRETSSSLNIQVTVSDGTNTSAAQAVTINLNDLNDVLPVVTAAQSRTINENLSNGSNVGAVLVATDGDVTATTFQNWTISTNVNPDADGNPAFAINASTGQLTVNDQGDLNFEVTPSLNIQVTVSDGTNTSAAQTVTINLNDLDEVPPSVAIGRQNASPINATSVTFRVTFNEDVNNVDISDFILNPVNTALGTLPGTVTTITANRVFDITVTGVSGNSEILNLDFNTNDITDIAGNAFAGNITSELEYVIDTVLPTLSPNEMTLNLNGTGTPETIEFTISEELNIPNGPVTGFTSPSNPGTILSAVYSGKGTTNTITLTSNANDIWTLATTISYSGGNVADLLVGNQMAAITAHTVILNTVSLTAGDIAFTSFKADNQDKFAFVLLKDIPTGTQIKITDMGWTGSAFRSSGSDGTITWTANTDYFAGTEIVFDGTYTDVNGDSQEGYPTDTNPFTVSVGTLTQDATDHMFLSTSGDQLFAFQGSTSSPTFLAGIHWNAAAWDAGTVDASDKSRLPSGLSASNSLAVGDKDDGAYNVPGGAIISGSVSALRTSLVTVANWDTDDNPANVVYPTAGLTNFILPPDLTGPFSPANGATVKAGLPNLVLTFNDNIIAGATTGTDIQLFDVTAASTVTTWNLGGGSINVTGTTATVTPSVSLTDGHVYRVLVAKRIFVNADNNGNTAISGATWQFTADAVLPTVTSIVRKTPAGAVTNAGSVQFTVNFSENVSGLAANDFSANVAGFTGTTNPTLVVSAASGTSVDVTINSVVGNGTLGLNVLTANGISDGPGNLMTTGTPTGTNQTYTIDQTPPLVTAIVRNNPLTALTNGTSVVYTVTFNDDIDNTTIADADFTKTLTNASTGTIVSIVETTATSGIFNVTVPTINAPGPADGTLRLDLLAAATINDAAGNDYNANFTTGEVYTFDQIPPTVTSIVRNSSTPTNSTSVSFTVTFSDDIDATTFTDADLTKTIVQNPSLTVGTATITETTATSGIFIVTIPSVSGDGTLRLDLLPAATINDDAGNDYNATFTGGQVYTIDNTAPTVTSFTIIPPPTTNSWSTTNGTTATTLTYRLTFNEDVTGITYSGGSKNFQIQSTGSISASNPTGPSSTTSNFVDITVTGVSGQGKLRYDFQENDNVIDAAGNPVGGVGNSTFATSFGPVPNDQYYTVVLPEPAIEAFTVTSSNITGNSITLSWNSTNTTQRPTHFLVMAKLSTGGSYPTLEDGTFPFTHHPISDGPLAQNVTRVAGTNSWTFNGLNSGTSYDFVVYKYTLSANNSSDNIDYETTTPGVLNGVVTNTAAVSWMTLNSTPAPISSTATSLATGVNVMSFKIFDDGQDPILPNVMTLNPNGVSQETITFTLRDELTLAEGASVTGFSSSTGAITSAIYSGKGTTNTITLTNVANGTWNSSTLISYSATTGNAQFLTLGRMQSIASHVVAQVSDITQTFNSNGPFLVPAGVTNIQVEAWGAGGSAGGWDNVYGGGSQGGGGGAYSRSFLTVNPGDNINMIVGTGGPAVSPNFSLCCNAGTKGGVTVFGPSLVVAEGGDGGESGTYFAFYGTSYNGFARPNSFGLGGQAANGTGDFRFSGGNGGSGGGLLLTNSGTGPFPMGPNAAGGGGSSAGPSANGNSGGSAPFGICGGCIIGGGAAVASGGSGGLGFQNSNGALGGFPGGGGGGTGAGFLSGAGANGQIKITYGDPTPLTGPSDWAGDNSPFKFSKIVITQGAGNNVPFLGDWRNIIAGAELSDGTSVFNSIANPLDITINANDITFNNLPSTAPTDIGFVPDATSSASSKTYTLKIWLKSNLSNSLAAVVDNLNLDFKVDPTIATNLVYDDATNSNQKSSRLASPAPSFNSGSSPVQVVASQLVYHAPGSTSPTNTNPQAQIGVGIPFSANVAGQDPEVYALDINNNLDLDYKTSNGNNGTITNPLQGFGQSIGSASFNNGKLLLNPFFFSTGSVTTANTQIVVTGTGSPAVTPATSTDVWSVISNKTTISEATAPASELASFASTITSLPATVNFDFTVTDDTGADGTGFTDNDALPTLIQNIVITQDSNNGTNGGGDVTTFDDWTKSIAGARLTDGTNFVDIAPGPNITGSSLIFAIPVASSMRTIPDGNPKTYQLKIWLKNPVDPTLQDIIDNKDFAFAINQGNITIDPAASVTSTFASSSASTGDGRNTVIVTATQLDFTTQPPPTQLYDINITTAPILKARDANQNLDTDYGIAATLSTVFVPAAAPNNVAHTYPLSNTNFTFSGGTVTLNPLTIAGSTGTGIHNDNIQLRVTPNSGPVTAGQSSTIQLKYSNTSDIVRDGTFTQPQNIVTINNREATTTSASVALDRFLLREGGASNDADGSKTKLQTITINVTNYQNIKQIALYDETNAKLQELSSASFSATGDITFGTLATFEANDDDRTTKKFTVRVSFKDVVTDNQQMNVSLVSALAVGNSSQLVTPLTVPIDALSANENKVEVVATQIDYTTLPPGPSASISVPFAVQVSARDFYGNIDLDYNGSITATETNPTSDLLFHTLNDPTGSFAGGIKDYPLNFQFDVGDGNVQLTITSGAASTAGESIDAGVISGTSPNINIISSFESQLVSDNINYGAGGLTQNIDFINYQATNITTMSATTTNGYTLDLLRLHDGGTDNTDLDGAPTSLNDLTLGLSNHQSIRRIAIYTRDHTTGNVAEVLDYDITDGALSPATINGYRTITFTNLNIVAPDNDYNEILVLATFQATPTTITDRDDIKVAVLGATLNIGSKFAPDATQTGTIGGVVTSILLFPEASGVATVGTKGYLSKLQVTATSLDFEDDTFTQTQPSALAGKQEPIDGSAGTSPGGDTGIVYARDKFGIIDTDFNFPATVTAPAIPISYPSVFVNGVLDLVGMQYQNAGDGTLKVASNGLDSDNIASGNSIPSDPVDVIHVTAVEDQNTVELSASLKGGTTNQRIFGVDFSAEHNTASEPKLTGFSFIFVDDNGDAYPYTKSATDNIYKNFKLFVAQGTGAPTPLSEGTDYTLTQEQTAALVATVPPASYKDKLTFVLTNPVDLFLSNYRFYLNVDVDVNVSVGTPAITPLLLDKGYAYPNTNDNIKTTIGSSTANVKGITRKFASTKPPVLVFTSPANGKLNVDPALNTIQLRFDVPVVTFDGEIKVYNRATGALRAIFTSSNGKFVDGIALKDQVVPILNFDAPAGFDFKPDTVYYVTVEKGVFSNTDVTQRKGISDEGFNLYGGISYSGTFYFKGSSPNAPVLSGTDATKYYFTPTTATFNFKFNQTGKVHYMVVHPTSPGAAPLTVTNDQILGNTAYTTSTIIKRGVTTIDQLSPNLQFVTIDANLANNIDYFVYAFAENDAEPFTVSTTAPYGSGPSFAVGANGPTLKIRKTAANTSPYNNPRFEICVNSSVKMEEPIIISEAALNPGDFSAGFTSGAFIGATQTFNILLPTGFQFDVTKAPTIAFNGSDFGTLPSTTSVYRFRNTALLEVNFVNSTSASLDNIVITNLYLIASAPDIGGNLIRFGGNGLTTVPEDKVLARITSGQASSVNFTNSYDSFYHNLPTKMWPYAQIENASPYKPITYIPDNFATTVRLIPEPPIGDYGSSLFSGSGLTNDELTLSAVTLDASFNITLNHTDQTGCATTSIEQYQVYDHTTAIPELLELPVGSTYKITGTKIGLIPGTPDPITNIPGLPTATLNISDLASIDGLAGYQLIDLYADIPVRVKNLPNPQVLDYNSAGWKTLVNNIPRLRSSVVDLNLGQTFKSYNWEYSNLINKNSTNAALVQYPYDPASRFARTVRSAGTGNGKTFFDAGSLGIIEFTGVYQSTADYSVFVPFKQEVELFIPAVPIVEVVGNSSNAGATPIFCEKGLPFIVTGYPQANSGGVTGYFTLRDSTTNIVITDPGFVDNGNGTASFDPTKTALQNGNKTIKIEYTFQQNNSPAIGTGKLYIRVTPNPVPNFTTTTLCEDINVTFTDTTPDPIPGDVTIKKWNWGFGDLSSPNNIDSVKNPIHMYPTAANYGPVTLGVVTNFNCPSTSPKSVTLQIGGTPVVGFDFKGVSVNDQIQFSNNKSTIANDTFGKLDWSFGDGTVQTVSSTPGDPLIRNPINHQYTLPKEYDVNLKVTSTIGCVNNLTQRIVVLSNAQPTSTVPYMENFEIANGMWIPSSLPTSSYGTNPSTWATGPLATSVIKITDPTTFGTRVAKTNLNGNYNPSEKSALYSPSFDISLLARPMVSFNSFTQIEVGDGVIIEYSVDDLNVADPLKKWWVLGDNLNEGVDWFNTSGITAKPGSQPSKDFGWSGFLPPNNKWVESKHVISNSAGKDAIVGKNKVVFRFALASAKSKPADITHEGFAFDNFRIGERTRTILLENFTTTNGTSKTQNDNVKIENDTIRNFNKSGYGTTVVKLNYHIGFSNNDPFNLDNPADPSARALYYNVKDAPWTFLDGNRPDEALVTPLFSKWGTNYYNSQTLKLGQVDIILPTTPTRGADGSIKFGVQVNALIDLPANTVVQVAVIERAVLLTTLSSTQTAQIATGENTFDYVLKKMLPNALGTKFGTPLLKNQSRSFTGFEYYPDPTKLYGKDASDGKDDLAIIVFLQNEDSKEVYQTELLTGFNDPPVVTGIEEPVLSLENIAVYPNPADNEFTVELPKASKTNVRLRLADQMGKVVYDSFIPAGSTTKKVNTEDLPSEIYILHVDTEGAFTRKKVLVTHNR